MLSENADRFRAILCVLEGMLQPWRSFHTHRRKHVILMRGLPGSGKSYFVEKVKKSCERSNVSFAVCSSDRYFTKQNKEYKHSNADVALAHAECRNEFVDAISKGCSIAVVDNTHILKWEYQIYQRIATLCG